MAAKKVTETTHANVEESVVDAVVPAVIDEPQDFMDVYLEPPKDANPLVPAIWGLASAGATALVLYLVGRWKKRKQKSEEVIPFGGNDDETTDNVPAVNQNDQSSIVELKGEPKVTFENENDVPADE